MSEYAQLLAVAARPYGGASPAEWLDTIAPGVDVSARRALHPLAESLATSSGHDDSGPLFAGVARFASGVDALRYAHTAAFGTALSAEELLATGLHDAVKLPGVMAERLALGNRGLWKLSLVHWHRMSFPCRPLGDWAETQTPLECFLPPGVPSTERRAMNDALDEVVVAAASELIQRTTAALRIKTVPGDDLYTQAARCLDTGFLTRYFRKTVWRGLETMRLHGRKVGRAGDKYLSYGAFVSWHTRQLAQQEWMKRMVVRDTFGQCKPRRLSEVVMSNKAKRSRLTAVLVGIEHLAVEDGLSAAMVTLTLPPVWHPNPAHGASSWGGAAYAPDHGATELASDWAAFLRNLHNVGVKVSGLRVVEPHMDGCPHLHVLVYFQPEDEATILERLASAYEVPAIKIRTLVTSPSGKQKTRRGVTYDTVTTHFSAMTNSEQPGDGGAHRVEFSRINRAVATAASYVQKYVAKAIEFDELGEVPKPDAAQAAAAHAAGWGYRRFAFFGLRSSLTLWDALRRAKKLPEDADPIAGLLWQHAKEGAYADFLRILGGLNPRGGYRVQATYHHRTSRYGDAVLDVVGVEVFDGHKVLLSLRTREPGRFELVEAECDSSPLTSTDSDDPPA